MTELEKLRKEVAELKEDFYVTRCVRSGCPYIHPTNRNCLKVGGFFTAVSNKHCPMMQNHEANIKLAKAKKLLEEVYPYAENQDDEADELVDRITDFLYRSEDEETETE
jgi:hypothetical protein